MVVKFTKHNLGKFEQILKNSGYIIRYEKGSFNAGYCILENKKIIVINKFYSTEARINCILDIIDNMGIDEIISLDADRKWLGAWLKVKREATKE
ncbi:MAG: hypothetical protein EA412_12715 [Chitinophagaceae bacterium]|nr:MAG: hypothetical protein EA412_12715 [Chitinophagaceae bacterium]